MDDAPLDRAVEAALARLESQLDEITRVVRFQPALLDVRVERVSGWSIGEQVDHMIRVLEAGLPLLDGLRDSLPRGMNLTGTILLRLRWIPRGIGKSPKGVRPGAWTAFDLAERAARLRKSFCETPLSGAILADPRPVFPHPYFGGLSAAQGIRFLDIHTRHHLKIVADIRRAAPGPEPRSAA